MTCERCAISAGRTSTTSDASTSLVLAEYRLHAMAAPGAVDLLDWLTDCGLPLAVASSSRSAWVKTCLHAIGLLRYFDRVVAGDMVARAKPDPEIYLLAARQLRAQPARCVVFEDSPPGVTAASRAGMYTIAVCTAYTPPGLAHGSAFRRQLPGRGLPRPARPHLRPRRPPGSPVRGARTGSATMVAMVSEIFDPERWRAVSGFSFTDITYHRAVDSGTVRVAFNRPEIRNAFRPHTVDELYTALDHARMSSDVGCVLLTGNGPSPKDGGWAFCSGGDQRIRGRDGYRYAEGETSETIDPARSGRLHILEVQRLIRFMPKVVICVVPGWAAGGGHSLHVVCDLTLASREHARFKQTDADVASFDGGFGSAYLARQVGQKFAREIFFLGDTYDAEEGHRMGTVNAVVPHADLEAVALEWAAKINGKSPTSQRMLKYAFNAIDDGLVGQQLFAGEATRLAYMTDEAAEGRDAFLEKREPDWQQFPWYY